jgi:hypothetical protein
MVSTGIEGKLKSVMPTKDGSAMLVGLDIVKLPIDVSKELQSYVQEHITYSCQRVNGYYLHEIRKDNGENLKIYS